MKKKKYKRRMGGLVRVGLGIGIGLGIDAVGFWENSVGGGF